MPEYYDERYRQRKKRDRKGEGPISRYKRKMRGSIDSYCEAGMKVDPKLYKKRDDERFERFGDDTESNEDLSHLNSVEKLLLAVEASIYYLPSEVAEEIKAIFTPATLATMVSVFAVYLAAHATGIGQAMDIGMLVAGGIYFGLDAFAIFKDIAGFAGAIDATTEEELEEAGEHLASAVAKIGVDAVMTLLTSKVADEVSKSVDHVNQVGEVTAASEGAGKSGANLNNVSNTNARQISDVDNANSSLEIETERTPVLSDATEFNENYKFTNPTGNWSRELGINHYKTGKIVKQMSSSEIGQRVVDATNADKINLTLSVRNDVPRNLSGVSYGNNGTAYVYNTQSYDETVLTLIHEGLHAMGIGGSRRAEALIRLAELEHQGIPINRKTIRQVLQEMRNAEAYGHMPWRVGRESSNFPGVEF